MNHCLTTKTFNDASGNRTQKIQPAGAGQEAEPWDYTFNIFNKLTKVEREQMGVKTECGFKYGADGYRVEKELVGGTGVSPVKRLYIMDGVHVILEKEIVGEGEPVTKARYIPGVCMITKDDEANEVIRYYHEDALGSFIAMTDENQNITALYQYDAWGNELLTQVSALRPQPSENPYRWCGALGYYRDRDAQMYLLGMRWYDPQTGRFFSRDPIGFAGGDENLHRYAANNSPNALDPRGTQKINFPFQVDPECIPFVLLAWFSTRSAANDLYKHCVLGCVIARRCGVLQCFLAGILKEDWDYYTGLGVADWDDLEATGVGCVLSFKAGTCENLCKGKFNPNLRR